MSRTVNGGRLAGRVVCMVRRHRWSDWEPASRLLKKTRECERCHKREVVWLRRAPPSVDALPSVDPLPEEDRGRSRLGRFSATAWTEDIERELDEMWEDPAPQPARAGRSGSRRRTRSRSQAMSLLATLGRWFIRGAGKLWDAIVRGLKRLAPAGRSGLSWTATAVRSARISVSRVVRSAGAWSIRALAAVGRWVSRWISRSRRALLRAVRSSWIGCRPHLRYAGHLVRRKWFVFRAGLRTGAPLWRLMIHDWSKLTPAEWGPYVRRFSGGRPGTPVSADHAPDLMRARLHHQHRNPHHWQAWILRQDDGVRKTLEMPEHFAREMVADWMGTGRAITGKWEAREWYENGAGETMDLHPATRELAERLLREASADGDDSHSER